MQVTKQAPKGNQSAEQNDENQARPIVEIQETKEPSVSEKLIRDRLVEYASSVSMASIPSNKISQYAFLHAAFRTLMGERGQSFLDCFKVFISTIRDANNEKENMHKTAFHGTVYGANLSLFSDTNEGRAFIAFMVLAVSYARTNDPSKFVQDKNIGRLTNVLADEELKKIVFDAFSGK